MLVSAMESTHLAPCHALSASGAGGAGTSAGWGCGARDTEGRGRGSQLSSWPQTHPRSRAGRLSWVLPGLPPPQPERSVNEPSLVWELTLSKGQEIHNSGTCGLIFFHNSLLCTRGFLKLCTEFAVLVACPRMRLTSGQDHIFGDKGALGF